MSSALAREILPRLKPGFTARPLSSDFFEIIGPDGNVLRLSSGQPLRIGGDDNNNTRRRQMNTLVSLGALDPVKPKRGAKMNHHPKRASIHTGQNPILVARAILSDPKASPRERSLARHFITSMEVIVSLKEQKQELGQRLAEREAELERA